MVGIFDTLEMAAENYQNLLGVTEVQVEFPNSITSKYAKKFEEDYQNKLKAWTHSAKVRGWTTVALLPTVLGAIIGGIAWSEASGIRDALKRKEDEYESLVAKGVLSFGVTKELDITPSVVSAYHDFEERYQNGNNIIIIEKFPGILLRDKALLVGPKDIQEKLPVQGKMVFTRGIISDRAQKTGSESDKIFILDGGEDGKVYCSFEAPEIAKFADLGLFKRHDGKKKQLSVDSLDEVIDSARASGQQIFVGGIAKEGKLEADMFLLPGGRQFAYLLK